MKMDPKIPLNPSDERRLIETTFRAGFSAALEALMLKEEPVGFYTDVERYYPTRLREGGTIPRTERSIWNCFERFFLACKLPRELYEELKDSVFEPIMSQPTCAVKDDE